MLLFDIVVAVYFKPEINDDMFPANGFDLYTVTFSNPICHLVGYNIT